MIFCKRCRYNLKLINTGACPECGRAFDPGNPKSYRKRMGMPKYVRRLGKVAVALLVVLLIALALVEWRYRRELNVAEAIEQRGGVGWSEDAHQWAKGIPFLHERLQHVFYVSLSNRQLATLPPGLWNLTKLKSLYVGGNQLTTLPPEIGTLTKLETLNLGGNQLTTLPPEIGKLTNLKGLYLDPNQLTTLPPEIGKLTNLKELYLFGNQLTALPPEIGKLTKLETLSLNENQLTTLPPEIGKLTKLVWLILNHNQLTTLPPEIGKLAKLESLVLSGNAITDADLEHLKSLKSLTNIYLEETKVTQQGVAVLKEALPNCMIESDF